MEETKGYIKILKILLNLLIAAAGIFIILYFGPKILRFFMPFVIGGLLSLLVNPLVRFLERRVKILRKHSSVIIIVLVLGLVGLILYLVFAWIFTEISVLAANLPEIYAGLEEEFLLIAANLQGVMDRLPEAVQDGITSLTVNLDLYITDLIGAVGKPTMTAAGNFAKNIPGTLVFIIFMFLSAYFFIADRERVGAFLERHMPAYIKKYSTVLAWNIKHAIGGYIKAQFKIMFVVAVILVIGFLILQVQAAILLAILIALLDFLPVFGTGTVLLPWAVYELLTADYKRAVGFLIIYAVSQLIRQIIQPKIMGDSIGLNPFMTLLFIFLGYKLSGLGGMIISIPLGIMILGLYDAGAFDNIIYNIKELVNEINKFRKI